ncbi:MAG: SCO family protein [Myxococcota bacterium]
MSKAQIVVVLLLVGAGLGSWFYTAAKPEGADPGTEIPNFELTNQAGETFGTEDLDGQLWIASFLFTRCKATCPALMVHLSGLQDALSDLERVHIVSFSVDPEYDTAEVLAKQATAYGVDPDRWSLVTGPRDSIETLVVDHFRFAMERAEVDGMMAVAHTGNVVLVDGNHRVVDSYATTPEQLAALAAEVRSRVSRAP